MNGADFAKTRQRIFEDVALDNRAVRLRYFREFEAEVAEFADATARAVGIWQPLYRRAGSDARAARVADILHGALELHVASLKLLLTGHPVASAHLFRLAVDTIAIALLASRPELDVLDRYERDRYAIQDAVADVRGFEKVLTVSGNALAALSEAREACARQDRLSTLGITAIGSRAIEESDINDSMAPDARVLALYRDGVQARVALARALPGLVSTVANNLPT